MPLWFMKFLPHGIVILLVGLGLWFVHHKGEEKANNRHALLQAQADKRQAEADRKADARARATEQVMQGLVRQVDANLGTRLRSLTQLETTVIQPTLTREIRSEKRFTDTSPAVGITNGMRSAINSARATSDPSCVTGANGSVTCSLPPARPAAR